VVTGRHWQRALAIVAHPDDLEHGAASAAARWTAQGKTVASCMVTSDEAGIGSITPNECGPLRDTIDLGIVSLSEHQTYLDALDGGASQDPDPFLRGFAIDTGGRVGVPAAVSFELVNL
jgi:hypothetical protein